MKWIGFNGHSFGELWGHIQAQAFSPSDSSSWMQGNHAIENHHPQKMNPILKKDFIEV